GARAGWGGVLRPVTAVRLGRHGRADNPGLHCPTARIPPTRLAPGSDPTGSRVCRPTRPEEGVRGRAGEDAAAADSLLTRGAVLLLGLRATAVRQAAARDQLQADRSRRPRRTGRPTRDLAGCEVNGSE